MDMAIGTPEELPMKKAREILEELFSYDQVPPTDLSKSTCTLTPEQTRYMLDIGMSVDMPSQWHPSSLELRFPVQREERESKS